MLEGTDVLARREGGWGKCQNEVHSAWKSGPWLDLVENKILAFLALGDGVGGLIL